MSYNGCKIKDYSRINPNTGAGFILTQLAARDMTRREVYEGTHYANRFGPGYHSSIWAKLLEDGLIEADGGFETVKNGQAGGFSRWRSSTFKRAKSAAGQAPIYHLTDEGWRLFHELCVKRETVIKAKKEFCKRNGIEFGTGKTLPTVEEFDEKIGPVGLLTVAEKIDNIIRDLQELRDSL